MRKLFLIILLLQTTGLIAQKYSFSGIVFDNKGNVVPYATVAMLDTADSTLTFYAVSNSSGNFEINNITAGSFILQTSFLGYKTNYSPIKIPQENSAGIKSIVMEAAPINLPAAEINSERIPLLIKGDTVEYNASSYKTQPDAVMEDLLKKLPGVEVDRNGNIKAQGEEVKKVTVDGKEFFGNDPKIATRNLPADAVNKVQVFDTKSDQAELTGINDGKRDKTINLELKGDRKSAWFGELLAGGGSDNHYQSSAKAYRFNPSKQIAILGMLNNINRFGFSFSDYMDFNGSLRGNGESLNISSGDNNFPIDIGEVENGLITSGAAGANYSSEARKDNRFNISYLANGINKKLSQQSSSTNFTGIDPFFSNKNSSNNEKNRAHRINFGWKNRIDTMHTFNLNGQVALSNNKELNSATVSNFLSDAKVSGQQGQSNINGNIFNGVIHSGFLKKMESKWKLLSFGIDGSWQYGLSRNEVNTLAKYYSPPLDFTINQFQQNKNDVYKYSVECGITRKTGTYSYFEGHITAGREDEKFSRLQGPIPESDGIIDSLSAELKKYYQWMEPRVAFRRIKEKSQLSLSLATRFTDVNNIVEDRQNYNFRKIYFLPMAKWEKEYNRSHRLLFLYESTVVSPKATEFFPVTNYFDPLNLITGNQQLKPEVHNDFRIHWSVFDQFSFTSVFTGFRFSYIKNKISWAKSIDKNLVQQKTLVNVPDDYQAAINAEYSRPIKKLGLNINLTADERWSKTLTYINGLLNSNSSLAYELGISFDNRKKNKWDISMGITLRYNRSLFSLPSASKQSFVKGGAFSNISYTPDDSWHFSIKADIAHYYGNAFSNNINVPLLQAEASFLFLKHKRVVLTLAGFDLLNRNTGVERISEYNYLMESHSDIIQRYVMFSFHYKLNKFSSNDKVDLKVNGH